MKTFPFFTLIISFSSLFCLQACEEKPPLYLAGYLSDGKVLVDTPYMVSKFYAEMVNIRRLSRKANLPDLINGYDSLQIRVWIDDGAGSGIKLIAICNTLGRWGAYELKFEGSDFQNTLIVKKMTPKSWPQLMTNLETFNIYQLRDYDQINPIDYSIAFSHGGIIMVEWANKERYRLYRLYTPYTVISKVAEAKAMRNIIKELIFQFDMKDLEYINYKYPGQTEYKN